LVAGRGLMPRPRRGGEMTGANPRKGVHKMEKTKVQAKTRRDFLKVAAVGVAGAGAASLGGLGTGTAEGKELPKRWDSETDVVVVGSGPAGICAAVAAVEKGASVCILEQNQEVGGNGVINGGILSIGGGTHIQTNQGIKDSAELLFQESSDYWSRDNRRNDPKLLRKFCDYNLSTFTWLEDHGVRFQESLMVIPGALGTPRLHLVYWDKESPGWLYRYGPGPSSGAGLIKPLEAAARERGAKIFLGHKMTSILKEGGASDTVVGVEAEAEGEKVYFRAKKGVFLGTGSWKGSRWLRKLFDPRMTEDLVASGEPFSRADGTGIIAGLEIGAALVSDRAIDKHLFHRMVGTRYYRFPAGSPYAAPGLGLQGQVSAKELGRLIIVNKHGKRYVNEAVPESSEAFSFYDASLVQEDHVLWAILDEAMVQRLEWDPRPPVVEEGLCLSAQSIPDLAKRIQVPADALDETIRKYNAFVDGGEDLEFGKPQDLLRHKIDSPPFWAVWVSIQVHDTLGGLATNEKAQVLDIYGSVIPGLYAAGEAAGGLDKIGMSRGIIMGRIAGEEVV
jgi:flavocytochrome c